MTVESPAPTAAVAQLVPDAVERSPVTGWHAEPLPRSPGQADLGPTTHVTAG